jgi:hypothetical protein
MTRVMPMGNIFKTFAGIIGQEVLNISIDIFAIT